jgi:hypothetical protein
VSEATRLAQQLSLEEGEMVLGDRVEVPMPESLGTSRACIGASFEVEDPSEQQK